MKTPKAVVVEEVEFLRDGGVCSAEIVDRLGMTAGAVARSLQRAGRYDLAGPFAALYRSARRAAGYRRPGAVCVDCGKGVDRKSSRCRPCEVVHRWSK